MFSKYFQGINLCGDFTLAESILEPVFWTVAQLTAIWASVFKKIRGSLPTECKHFISQIPNLALSVSAAADSEPVKQGMSIHAYDGLENSGLGFEIAQIFLWNA